MSDNQQKSPSELVDELGKLGENMGTMLKNLWNTDERKYVEAEIRSGLDQLSRRLNMTMDQRDIEANLKKAKTVAMDAWESARGPKLVEDLRTSMLDSLRMLNAELVRRTQTKAAHEAKTTDDGPVI